MENSPVIEISDDDEIDLTVQSDIHSTDTKTSSNYISSRTRSHNLTSHLFINTTIDEYEVNNHRKKQKKR